MNCLRQEQTHGSFWLNHLSNPFRRVRRPRNHHNIDANRIADALLSAVLQWEIQEQSETAEGIQRGFEASNAGRVRAFADFAAHMRIKYALPVHLSDSEIGNTP